MGSTRSPRFLMRLQRRAQHELGIASTGPDGMPTGGMVSLAGGRWALEPLFANHRTSDAFSFGILAEWYVATPETPLADDGPAAQWQAAHDLLFEGFGAADRDFAYVEPDLVQEWPYVNPTPMLRGLPSARAADIDVCEFNDQDPDLPEGPGFAWFLDEEYSQLAAARERVAAVPVTRRVRIAHLDTGYDPDHVTRPRRLRDDLARSFVDGEPPDQAVDPARRGFLKNPGHGTGTLSILAGNALTQLGGEELGGAPDAEVIPVRIAESVVLIRTSALARALDYVLAPGGDPGQRVDVVSLSMGGVASFAWAEAVNRAYEVGICLVAAAGNNFSGLPTRFIVYPARFRRVVAACGVMADGSPYWDLPLGAMQGNWGPRSKMATAIAASTPNMPWAELGCPGIVDHDGQGTSSATPQVAAAAALWLQYHQPDYDEPWKRVEAVRHALFLSAGRSGSSEPHPKLGQGVLRAMAALDVAPPAVLHQTRRDSALFSFLRVLTGLGISDRDRPRLPMLALEATQLAGRVAEVADALPDDPDLPAELIAAGEVQRFADAVLDSGEASPALQAHLEHQGRRRSTGRVFVPAPPPAPSPPRESPLPGESPRTRAPAQAYPSPPARRLRGYAFDPSLSLNLETAIVNEVRFEVPWEDVAPGPVGELLEVVDVDPASGCFYAPVDLNDPFMLAQDGLPPSDGDPQFHQQMTYAVAMLTIRAFERALGRPMFWVPGPGEHPRDDSQFVQRLRIYPHALREANAYYSPSKVALMFGYFPADPASDVHLPGGTVFTCLSHDIIAHETTHAMLDGMHRNYRRPTNADTLAFHEAFADMVALFQHFTFPEILRHQVFRSRGNLRAETLLGQLAWEFGRAVGGRGALRSAIGERDPVTDEWRPKKVDAAEYDRTVEPHRRGAILVAAMFDAFLSIYDARVADLLRLATDGSGLLPEGAISPDLAARLSREAAKAAGHIQTMCIRALDYCPPVDLTFGEYLRALVTADADVYPRDEWDYRIAFVQAFRRRGIFPDGVRTMSIDSLLWKPPHEVWPFEPLRLGPVLESMRPFARRCAYTTSRERLFFMTRDARRQLHERLEAHFATEAGRADARVLRLVDPHERTFEVHSLRVAERVGPHGAKLPQLIIEIIQRIDQGTPDEFEGGCTLVVDLQRLDVRYCIYKSVGSRERRDRQRRFRASYAGDALRATYFPTEHGGVASEPFRLLHRRTFEGADDV